MRRGLACAAALTVSAVSSGHSLAPAPAPLPPALARSVRGLAPDTTLACIRIIDAVEPSGAGDTILWRTGRRLYYRNDTLGGCTGLGRGDRIVTERLSGDRLCRGDVVRTRDRTSGVLTGSCTLGEFVRYATPGRARSE